MSRSGKFVQFEPKPDPMYKSVRVSKFINYLMLDGKKSVAQKVLYDAFEEIKKQTNENPVEVFERALKNASPNMEVRSQRVGGANYQVPREVMPKRKMALAMRWILKICRLKKGKPMHKHLAEELISAASGEGEVVKKREDMHKMAEANKAFAHFAR